MVTMLASLDESFDAMCGAVRMVLLATRAKPLHQRSLVLASLVRQSAIGGCAREHRAGGCEADGIALRIDCARLCVPNRFQ